MAYKQTIKSNGVESTKYHHQILSFRNLKSFQSYLRKSGKAPDFVKIGNLIYTMEEYDMSGKQVSYRNKRTTKGFIVETENRYGETGYKDAVLSRNEGFYRNDIGYYD